MGENQSSECFDQVDLVKRIESLVQDKDWQGAINILWPIYEAGDLSFDATKTLAYCLSMNRDHYAAIGLYKELCQRQPRNSMLAYGLGFQYQSLKEWEDAGGAYQKCIELFPQFLKAYLQLGEVYEAQNRTDDALSTYRQGVFAYRQIETTKRGPYSGVCAKMLTNAAALLQSLNDHSISNLDKIDFCLREAVACEPANADNQYRLGKFLMSIGRTDEALKYLSQAQSLSPHKVYITHKIAQLFLQSGDTVKSLDVYNRIPLHKRLPYILNGMAACLCQQGKIEEAAKLLFKAVKCEPEKFYHFRDLGLTLLKLGDRDQALNFLNRARELFRKDFEKESSKIIGVIEDAEKMPEGEHFHLEEATSSVAEIRRGRVTKYISERGFGFIKDDQDQRDVFFHIKSLKPRVEPEIGMAVRFLREIGEKGFGATKVWVSKSKRN